MKIDGGLSEARKQAAQVAKTTGRPMSIWQDRSDFYVLPAKSRRRPTETAEWVNDAGPHQPGRIAP